MVHTRPHVLPIFRTRFSQYFSCGAVIGEDMKKTTLLVLVLLGTTLLGQEGRRMISYDFRTGVYDTLETLPIDSTITSDQTDPYFGWGRNALNLPQVAPVADIYPNSAYTVRRPAAELWDLNAFPASAAVKTLALSGDSAYGICSGSFISRKHVLSSAHCYLQFNADSVVREGIRVCPSFDNGTANSGFGCTDVVKLYFFESWYSDFEDLVVLEVEEPLGSAVGYLGIGYAEDADLLNKIYHKFSYPSIYFPQVDSTVYNGDTLYFGYGVVDEVRPQFLRIQNTYGIPGESGSSLVQSESFITYGVSTFSPAQGHSRIEAKHFVMMREIIRNELEQEPNSYFEEVRIYPNPAREVVHIESSAPHSIDRVEVFEMNGRLLESVSTSESITSIRIHDYPKGIYLIRVHGPWGSITKRLVVT